MQIELSFPGGDRVDAHFGGFTVPTDQPSPQSGRGSAPAPFALFLTSIATCAGIYVLRFCQERGLPTEGLRMLRGGGCYLEVGSIAPGSVFSYDATALVRGNARLVATSNYSPWALEQALAFLRRNLRRFPFERLVSHVFALERISDGFRQADWMQRQGDPLRLSRAAIAM